MLVWQTTTYQNSFRAKPKIQEALELSRQMEARKESQPLIRESRSSATHDVDFKKKPGAHKTHHHHRGQNVPSSGYYSHNQEMDILWMGPTCLRRMSGQICNMQGMLEVGSLCNGVRVNHKTVYQVSDTETVRAKRTQQPTFLGLSTRTLSLITTGLRPSVSMDTQQCSSWTWVHQSE